ncbi:MATE family efflux transporter [Halioglobus japonicus]|uniref:Multidrug-efflux transporter n=1 Tax=Halioglobus japonicus TaxID=930805 RepID=A0AAP8SLS0_9GAMM|nr:MATE family efflux transporter [Halioglobus japonicus]AQA19929.1 MATE family efflux transporter [Halioglobus japonicus]PLW84661.1 MATE family efflux transporter [Halioglobus japonicus]GHD23134.1 multidrug resistance protein PmpM [Halioglobus japonicus]
MTTTFKDYRKEAAAVGAIAWPTVIAQLAQMGTGVVDTVMAGRYSSVDLAAIAIGYNIWLPLFLLTLGIMLAVSVIVAQDFGARKIQAIRDILPQSLWLAIILGAIVGPICYQMGPLLDMLELDPITSDKSLAYMQAVAFGLPAVVIFQALRCHTQGLGIMRPFAVASVLGFIANIPLNYMLIYGKWGAPELGAAGCGWATAISMWLSPLLIGGYILFSKTIKPYLPERIMVAPDWTAIGQILRLGLPIGLTFFLEIGVFTVVSLMIATLGNNAMAAHQIAYNVWDVVYMPLISVGSAMATRVGHAIGSGRHEQIKLAVATGTGMTLLVGVVSTVVLLSIPSLIISAYTAESGIHVIALRLVQLVAIFIVIDSTQVAASYVLRAFKDTRFPFLVMCFAYWGLSLPLSWWLGLKVAENPSDGTAGIWVALIAGICFSTVLVGWRLYGKLQKLPVSAAAHNQGIQDGPQA